MYARAGLIVRDMTASELQYAIALGREMHAESRFSVLPFDEAKTKAYSERIAYDDTYIRVGAFQVSEGGGETLIGMVIGSVGQYHPFSSAKIASEYLLFIAKAHRRYVVAAGLIRAFISRAKAMGAADIVFGSSTGYEAERVGRLFERLGLRRVGGIYAVENCNV